MMTWQLNDMLDSYYSNQGSRITAQPRASQLRYCVGKSSLYSTFDNTRYSMPMNSI